MLKPKAAQPHSHWDSLSDEQLVDLELEIDDPRTLSGLVLKVPSGDVEPHVEFKYDLRGQDVEEFICCHCHQGHKAGLVMNLGGVRYLVGWQCGASIYGEDFNRYTADYNAVVNRRDALLRVRDLKRGVEAFKAWVEQVEASGAIRGFTKLRGVLYHQMPWVYDNLTAMSAWDSRAVGATLPRHLCAERVDLRDEFARLVSETAAVAVSLIGDPEKLTGALPALRTKIDGLARRADMIVKKLDDVVLFFQPAALELIAKHANEHDNPKRRRYQAGLLSLSVRGVDKCEVRIPDGFSVPSRAAIEALQKLVAS